MEDNKNMQNNKKSEELDVMITKTSPKREIPQRARQQSAPDGSTRTIKPIAKREPGNSDAAKTTVNTPAVKKSPSPVKLQKTADVPKVNDNKPTDNTSGKKGGGLVSGIAKALIYIVAVIVVSGILSYYGIVYSNDIFAFVKDDKSAQITIDESTTVSELASLLHSEGMIEHPGVFKFYTWYRHRNNEKPVELAPGTYTVSSQLNYDMMLSLFKKKTNARNIVTLTFKEGLTVDETIKIFTDAGVGTREEFIKAINEYDYDYQFVKALENWDEIPGRKYRLEGYLYPDTYDFYTDSDESFIISKLLSNFNQKFEEEYYDRCTALGYTVDEIINLASIIEKEGYLQEDLVYISSVFHNRLAKWANPYLQSDATIQYSFEERKKELSIEDLKIDTPYNTYLYKGLPPSAIANPGLESILAALYPVSSDYYYFVTYKNGAAIFSKTLGEHNDAKIQVANAEKNS